MIVEEIMQTNIITLSPEDTILEAHQLMHATSSSDIYQS